MQLQKRRMKQSRQRGARPANWPLRLHRARTCACLILIAIAGMAGAGQQTGSPLPPRTPHPILLPEANRLPDANDVMRMREQKIKLQHFEAANIERKRQIAEDSANLIKLAAELKAEIDKNTGDTFSLLMMRQTDEIERLAHNVKEKMKLTVGTN